MCFDDALDGFDAYLKANRGLSANTRRAYRSDVEECLVALRKQGCVDLNEVTIEDLRLWMAKSSKNHARSSMARKTVAVRGFFAWAYDHDMASANPAASLQTPKIPDTLPAVLNETQAQQLMDRVDEDGMEARSQEPNMKKQAIALRDAAMLELLYATGMRVAELVGLDVADVTFGNRTVKVTGKGDKQRVMPFGAPADKACAIGWNMAVPYYAVTCRTTRSFWDRRAGGSVNVWCARWCTTGHGRPACLTSVRMRCATVRRPICSTGERTCVRCRRCWGIPR